MVIYEMPSNATLAQLALLGVRVTVPPHSQYIVVLYQRDNDTPISTARVTKVPRFFLSFDSQDTSLLFLPRDQTYVYKVYKPAGWAREWSAWKANLDDAVLEAARVVRGEHG